MPEEIIDMFCHFLPPKYVTRLEGASSRSCMLARARDIATMTDIDSRLRAFDQFPGYRQVITLAYPPVESLAASTESPVLARIANTEMAEVVRRYPDRIIAFAAALPLNNVPASLLETEYAFTELGARGVQLFTNVNGASLDEAQLAPLFDMVDSFNGAIWLHPARGMETADYKNERVSKYELWWAFGWTHETTVAMGRLVFSGVFERWPNLRIITHHVGGAVPMMEGRLRCGMQKMGSRTPPEYSEVVRTELTEPPLEAFKRFYADTASFGSRAAVECGLAFFGIDHLLFASDAPFGSEQGVDQIRRGIDAIDAMNLDSEDRVKIFSGNARKILERVCNSAPVKTGMSL